MRKSIVFIFCIILGYSNSFAEDNSNLPELPPTFETTDQNQLPSTKSFWQRFKEFFGFGDEESVVEQKEINASSSAVASAEEGSSLEDDEGNEERREPPAPSASSFGEDSANPTQVLENNNAGVQAVDEVPDQLQLPEGFGDEIPEENNSLEQVIDQNTEKTSTLDLASSNRSQDSVDPNKAQEAGASEEGVDASPIEVGEDLGQSTELGQAELGNIEAEGASSPAETVVSSNQNNVEQEVTHSDAEELMVPDYANSNNTAAAIEQPSALSKYRQELEAKKSGGQEVPKISPHELAPSNVPVKGNFGVEGLTEVDPIQLKFINNEAQVLILPNDEVVLGNLTEEGRLEQMDFRSYVKIFWDNYDKLKREPKRLELEEFIENYDKNFNESLTEDY